ncbi:MAG: aldehyde dehydrogenase family protein [Acidimicrobiia bacterium]|nr:aldehyde dehydrogenase family protein [Acidimicrobiia bacterium]NND14420.1 aldehyde dehydrogenase [Acidimicrobiia bacterium]NNL29087.1 aldehyde dehydrogenase [Acidimicrobiia bacterium]
MATDVNMYVAGEWTEGSRDAAYELKSPATGEHIANIPMASQTDIDRAVAAARAAQEDFRHWSAFERAELCLAIAAAIEPLVEEIARIQTLEQGKPYHAESLDDIAEANQYFYNAAEDVKRLTGDVIPTSDRNKRMFTFHRPVGVWAAITPWNFPVTIPLEYVGPGLAAGNAVIVKPPLHTSWALLKLAEAFDAAGVPKGLVSIIPGEGDIGEMLVTHDGVDAIGFTGSSATGRRIISQMGIKRSIMEMSGNGPTIVTGDADVAAAAEAAVYGAYYNAGQVCCATERVIVVDAVHEEFVERAMKAAEIVHLGDPFAEETTMGPLNNEPTAAKMDRHIADAVERGARVLAGGGRRSGFPTDLYYDFTLIDDVPEDSAVSQEESFGPVLPILSAANDQEAVDVANRSRLGLQAAVFTKSLSKAFWYADRIRSGTVVVNDSTDFWETFQPFGGAAGTDTGWGRGSLIEFTDLQTVVLDLDLSD